MTDSRDVDHYRRRFLKGLGVAAAAAAPASARGAWGGQTLADAFAGFFQDQYQRMTPDEVREALARIERKARRRYGVDIRCKNTPPQEGVVFGYAINISECRGYRDCVEVCMLENNLSRDMRYIQVLELDQGSLDFEQADRYYDRDLVPAEGKSLTLTAADPPLLTKNDPPRYFP
jgi:molybdopterin-containing oxidoreductase family iron-sulfur binding subunit